MRDRLTGLRVRAVSLPIGDTGWSVERTGKHCATRDSTHLYGGISNYACDKRFTTRAKIGVLGNNHSYWMAPYAVQRREKEIGEELGVELHVSFLLPICPTCAYTLRLVSNLGAARQVLEKFETQMLAALEKFREKEKKEPQRRMDKRQKAIENLRKIYALTA